MSSAFDIGLREAVEAGILVALAGVSVPRPWPAGAVPKFWGALAAAMAVSCGVSWAMYESAAPLASRLVGIGVAFCLVAAVALTASALWVARRAHPVGSAAPALPVATATVIAALALVRETAEATWFLAADHRAGASSPVGRLVLGAAVGAAIVGGIFGVLFATARQRTIYLVAETLLVLIAAGMLGSATRAVHDAGWSAVGSQTLFELGFLERPSAAVARFAFGVIGVQPEITVAEGATWLAYAAVIAVIAWHTSAASLRLGARRMLR